mmetsp:Transcript_10923/g.27496  ORF Transcript_10923/g.27496 Transcript_10923/m.27496 type:complete len:426 (+) Transcript_10923:453-1730(+)
MQAGNTKRKLSRGERDTRNTITRKQDDSRDRATPPLYSSRSPPLPPASLQHLEVRDERDVVRGPPRAGDRGGVVDAEQRFLIQHLEHPRDDDEAVGGVEDVVERADVVRGEVGVRGLAARERVHGAHVEAVLEAGLLEDFERVVDVFVVGVYCAAVDELVDGGGGLGVEVAAEDDGDVDGELRGDFLELLHEAVDLEELDVREVRVPEDVCVCDAEGEAGAVEDLEDDNEADVSLQDAVEDARVLHALPRDRVELDLVLATQPKHAALVERGAPVDLAAAAHVFPGLGLEDAVVAHALQPRLVVVLEVVRLDLLQAQYVGVVRKDLADEVSSPVRPRERPRVRVRELARVDLGEAVVRHHAERADELVVRAAGVVLAGVEREHAAVGRGRRDREDGLGGEDDEGAELGLAVGGALVDVPGGVARD